MEVGRASAPVARPALPGSLCVLAAHDEIVIECDQDQTEAVEAWLEKAMIDGMDEVLNASSSRGPACRTRSRSKLGGPGVSSLLQPHNAPS